MIPHRHRCPARLTPSRCVHPPSRQLRWRRRQLHRQHRLRASGPPRRHPSARHLHRRQRGPLRLHRRLLRRRQRARPHLRRPRSLHLPARRPRAHRRQHRPAQCRVRASCRRRPARLPGRTRAAIHPALDAGCSYSRRAWSWSARSATECSRDTELRWPRVLPLTHHRNRQSPHYLLPPVNRQPRRPLKRPVRKRAAHRRSPRPRQSLPLRPGAQRPRRALPRQHPPQAPATFAE